MPDYQTMIDAGCDSYLPEEDLKTPAQLKRRLVALREYNRELFRKWQGASTKAGKVQAELDRIRYAIEQVRKLEIREEVAETACRLAQPGNEAKAAAHLAYVRSERMAWMAIVFAAEPTLPPSNWAA